MRQFAERIEGRIRSQGLIVDVLHPHEDIPLRQILTDLAARGTLYGVVLTPQNLEYGSLTLSILFGQPEGKIGRSCITMASVFTLAAGELVLIDGYLNLFVVVPRWNRVVFHGCFLLDLLPFFPLLFSKKKGSSVI